jgi:hypothetical protein
MFIVSEGERQLLPGPGTGEYPNLEKGEVRDMIAETRKLLFQ